MIVNEIFAGIQGEGFWAGRPMTFLRLQGCNLHCPWCDTKKTWSDDGGRNMSVRGVRHEILKLHPRTVCVTGGEPLLQWGGLDGLVELYQSLKLERYWHLETNGTIRVPPNLGFQWVTVSPKPPEWRVDCGHYDEIKIVIRDEDDLERILTEPIFTMSRVALQPLDNDKDIARMICRFLARLEGDYTIHWGLSMQLHKILDLK